MNTHKHRELYIIENVHYRDAVLLEQMIAEVNENEDNIEVCWPAPYSETHMPFCYKLRISTEDLLAISLKLSHNVVYTKLQTDVNNE